MNFEHIKKDFPIFKHHEGLKKSLVYLDSAATSQKPQSVIDALVDFYTTTNANIHRGLYDIAENATAQYEAARQTVARFFNAADPCEIIFTKGTTEGINFIAQSWALQHLKTGDTILLSDVEHHANLLPWQWVAEKTGATLSFISYDPSTGYLRDPLSYLTPAIKLVAIAGDSNVVGQIWEDDQLAAFIKAAHGYGAKVLIDAAQSVMHRKIDIQALDTDFLVCSGHKMFGPTGVGVLYIKKALHDHTLPYQRGGSMIHSAAYYSATWAPAPAKFEAGTPPIADVIGLAHAINYITTNIDFDDVHTHEATLCRLLIEGLEELPGFKIAGNSGHLKKNGYLVSFAIDGVHQHDLAAYLGQHGIAVRVGHFCAQPFVGLLGFDGLLRVSFSVYNTTDDVTTFINVLTKGVAVLRSTCTRGL